MKKLVLMFAAVAAISFASCGNKTEAPAEGADSVETVAEDSAAQDSTDSTAVAEDSAAVENDSTEA